ASVRNTSAMRCSVVMLAPQTLKSSETAFGPGVPSAGAVFFAEVFFVVAFLAVGLLFAAGFFPVACAAGLADGAAVLATNCPRSCFLNRDAPALVATSRMMAA